MSDTGTPLEHLQKMTRGEVPAPPVARLIGFQLVEIEKGASLFRLDVDERLANPMGTLHGGILCDIADAAMGCCMASTLAAGETYTTLDLSINFLKPVWKGRLEARGRLVKRTRKVGLVECDVTDEKGSLVARAKSTCLMLDGADAAGR